MIESKSDMRRRLPAVDQLLSQPDYVRLSALYGRDLVRQRIRAGLDEIRRQVTDRTAGEPESVEIALEDMANSIRRDLDARLGRGIVRVLNCTGVFLHTNLGRAPLPSDVAQELVPLLDAYCDLEIDLETGGRSDRNRRARALLTELTGAESALVTNNNAAALVLVLATLARGKKVIVSRGELVEIGGSFRIPDILQAAGSHLVEVGTTNRTRLSDYEKAVDTDTSLLLKVNPSNYRLSGFVESVAPAELAKLSRRLDIPLLVDEGSGVLRPHPAPQMADHESIQSLIAAGCDMVCGSGDKVLGGPQAGLLLGRRTLIDLCRHNPLYRALRPDRAVFGALEKVLRRQLAGAEMPLARLWQPYEDLGERLRTVAQAVGAKVIAADAYVGGGAAPEKPIPGEALALPGSNRLLEALRLGDPAVVGYIREGTVVLDLRTVNPEDDRVLIEAVNRSKSKVHQES